MPLTRSGFVAIPPGPRPGLLEIAETVPTESGAHTIGIDKESHTVYAFLPTSEGAAVYEER